MTDELRLPEITFKEDLEAVGTLKPKMVIFIAEVLAGASPSDAAERAGYARSAGYRLIKLPEVLEVVLQHRRDKLRELEVSENRVIGEIAKMAFFDPRNLFHQDGTPKAINELDDLTAACIAGLEVQELWEGRGDAREQYGVVKKLKLADKKGALELLGRYLKLWTDRLEVSGPEALAERLRKGRQNVGKEIIDAEPAPTRE
jgi:phage terminase small subunit